MKAVPAARFARPPYAAFTCQPEGLVGPPGGSSYWAGIYNREGFNCLTFTDKPGVVFTDYASASRIADEWNKSPQLGAV